MKKWKHTLGAAVLAASLLTGGVAFAEGEEEEAPVAVETVDEEADREAPVAEAAPAAGEEPAPAESESTVAAEETPTVGLPNPYIEYPDVPALERAIGFPVLYLPNNFYALYHPAVHAFSIAGQVADLRFKSKADDSTITLRTALFERVRTKDISGFYGVEWTTQHAGDVKRTKVDIAVTPNGTKVVRWSAGRFVFALALSGFDDNAFKSVLKNFVVVADRFAHKYRNFTLNKPKKQNKDAAAEAAAAPAQETAAAASPQETAAAASPQETAAAEAPEAAK